jgi:glycosyltransferase involved in cell wall biosynthesis
MKTTLISIIIPFKNGADYLERSLSSVINQSYKNIEIICIDNNSTDQSATIVNKYCRLDNRVNYFFCEDMGVSNARNMGIQNSNGNYIMFLDCDDWLENNAVGIAYENMVKTNVDMVVFGISLVNAKTSKKIESKDDYYGNAYFANKQVLSSLEVLANLEKAPIFCFGRLYKSSIIRDNKIFFNSDLKFNEDVAFNFAYCVAMKNAIFISNKLYNFRINNTKSTMANVSKIYNDFFISLRYIKNILDNHNLFEIAKKSYHAIAIRNIEMLARKKSLSQMDFYIRANDFLQNVDDSLLLNKKIQLLKKSYKRFYIQYKIISNIKYFLGNYLLKK